MGRDFSVEVDIAGIPNVDSVMLMGLDFSMRPEKVRYEVSKGFLTPAPEDFAMHKIKSLALLVYEQESYHSNVCVNRNVLAHFLCAVHCQAAPQPKRTQDRQTSISSEQPETSQLSCKSSESRSSCELPPLSASSMLPLGYWDGLYYALLAEIRQMHSDLQDKFGWATEGGTSPMHYSGINGTSETPVTAIELASMLESAWYTLMDNRLVAALDDAVVLRKLFDSTRKAHKGPRTDSSVERNKADDDITDDLRPPVISGLVDINGMTTAAINDMLWEVYAPEIDRACSENFVDESMLTDHHAELRMQQVEQLQHAYARSSFEGTCPCRGKCICQVQCDNDAGHCMCVSRSHSIQKTTSPSCDDAELENEYLHPSLETEMPVSRPSTSSCAEMQFNGSSTFTSTFTQTRFATAAEHIQGRKMPIRYANRPRTNANNRDLIYVPESKSSRGKGKDKYPLGFYTDGSPGRYPKLRKKPSAASQSIQPGDAVAKAYRMPSRKPVATPSEPVHRVSPDAEHGVVIPPLNSSCSGAAAAIAKAQGSYEERANLYDATTQAHDAVTHSFPATSENPRIAAHSDPFVDNVGANDCVDLLAQHPSSLEDTEKAGDATPALTHSDPTTPPHASKVGKTRKSTTHLPTLKSLAGNISKPVPPLPPLPEPDFIAPRPATVQRYVSAGGSMPLAEREPIEGPAFKTSSFNTTIQHNSGAGITKKELDAKMADPEWVSKHFGEVAAEHLSLTPPKEVRGRAESRAVANSQRNSRETGGRPSMDQGKNPRERTSSGVSRRFKRVFSRKNSSSEYD